MLFRFVYQPVRRSDGRVQGVLNDLKSTRPSRRDMIWLFPQGGGAQHDFNLAWLEASWYYSESGHWQARHETRRFIKKRLCKMCITLLSKLTPCTMLRTSACFRILSTRRLSPQFQFSLSVVSLGTYLGAHHPLPPSCQQVVSHSQISWVSPSDMLLGVALRAYGGERGKGVKSYDVEKARSSINHSTLFGCGAVFV